MSVTSSTQAVSTAAKIGTPSLKRSVLVVYSPSSAAATVWIGGSNVTSSNGFPLNAGDRIVFTNDGPNGMPASHEWYAVASSSVTLQITEAY